MSLITISGFRDPRARTLGRLKLFSGRNTVMYKLQTLTALIVSDFEADVVMNVPEPSERKSRRMPVS